MKRLAPSALAIGLALSSAAANGSTHECHLGNRGHGKLEISQVTGHPELRVYTFNLKTKLAQYPQSIPEGSLVTVTGSVLGTVMTDASIVARGAVDLNADKANWFSDSIIMQSLDLGPDRLHFQIADSHPSSPAGYLQLGYGVVLSCSR